MGKKCVYYISEKKCRVDGKPPTCNGCGCFTNKEVQKRYRVETKISTKNYFRADCEENDLDKYKTLIKQVSQGAVCYYREFPVSKNKKVYF